MSSVPPTLAPSAGAPFPIEPARLGVWLFLATEALLFAGLIGAYVFLRTGKGGFAGPGEALDLRLAWSATALLVTSSLVLLRLPRARRTDARARTRLVLGLVLGALFLALQAWEWRALAAQGVTPRQDLYWSSFFVLTGVHGLHVAGGLVVLAWFGLRSAASELSFELALLYWHFVDLVWLVLFTLLYLAA